MQQIPKQSIEGETLELKKKQPITAKPVLLAESSPFRTIIMQIGFVFICLCVHLKQLQIIKTIRKNLYWH